MALAHSQTRLLARLPELLDVALSAHRSSPPRRDASGCLLGPPICDQLVGKVPIQSFLQVWIGPLSRIRHDRSLLTAPA
jgi:hypothetical protein